MAEGKRNTSRGDDAAAETDPLDNPALMAVIAGEVAPLSPQDGSSDGEAPAVEASSSFSAAPAAAKTDALFSRDLPGALGIPPEFDMEAPSEVNADSRRSILLGLVIALLVAVGVGAGSWMFFGDRVDPNKIFVYLDELLAPFAADQPNEEIMSEISSAPELSLAGGVETAGAEAAAVNHPAGDDVRAATAPSLAVVEAARPVVEEGVAAQDALAALPAPVEGSKTSAPPEPAAPLPPSGEAAVRSLSELIEPEKPTPAAAGVATPKYAALALPQAKPTPLKSAPRQDLLRQTPSGALPVIGPDGATPWQTYARPFNPPAKIKGQVAVVVANLGLEAMSADAAISRLPPEVTLSFSVYAPDLDALMRRARDAGHEVMLSIPLESDLFPVQDPGPLGLLASMPPSDILMRLETALGKAGGYIGVQTLPGARFEASPAHVRLLEKALAERGLLLLMQGETSVLFSNQEKGSTALAATVAIDGGRFQASVDARLKYLGDMAVEQGTAVAVVDATPLIFNRFAVWFSALSDSGLVLAPVSSVFSNRRMDAGKKS